MLKVKYEATIKIVVTGEVENNEDLNKNIKNDIDEGIKESIKDGIGEDVKVSIDSNLEVEEVLQ